MREEDGLGGIGDNEYGQKGKEKWSRVDMVRSMNERGKGGGGGGGPRGKNIHPIKSGG